MNARGLSIIEGLVALSIVGVTVMGLVQLVSMSTSNIGAVSGASCREIARSSLARLEAIAYRPNVENYVETKNDPVGAPTQSTNPIYAIPQSIRWQTGPNFRILDTSQNPPLLRSSNLINGSITALQSLYNSNIEYCKQPEGVAFSGTNANGGPQNFLMTPNEAGMNGITSTIRIQPYMVETKQLAGPNLDFACPTPPLFLRPAAITKTATNQSTYFDFPPESRSDLGFLATVFVSYTDAHGLNQKCNVSQPFFYYRDNLAPLPPVVTVTPNIPPSANCSAASASVTVNISFAAGAQMESGAVLQCRDLSNFPGPATGPLCDGSGPGNPAAQDFTSAWVPCDALTICGVPPSSPSASTDSNGATYSMIYYNVPWTCNVQIQVLTLDVAGNNVSISPAAQLLSTPTTCYGCWNGQDYCNPASCPPPPPPPPPPPQNPPCYYCIGGPCGGCAGGGK